MKRIVIALLVLMTIFSLANAQKQTTVINDSTGNVKVTVTKDKDAKTNAGNTAVTVVGMDDEDADTTHVSTSKASTPRGPHGKASISIVSDDDDFPFNNFGNAVGGGILVAIISIIAIFGMPVFIIFVVFFFRYKNRKARYRLAEQALAAGRIHPGKQTDGSTHARYQKHLHRHRTLHIPLGDYRRIRNRSDRTARYVHGNRAMAGRLQTTK